MELSPAELKILQKALSSLLWKQDHTCQPPEIRNPTAAFYVRVSRLVYKLRKVEKDAQSRPGEAAAVASE